MKRSPRVWIAMQRSAIPASITRAPSIEPLRLVIATPNIARIATPVAEASRRTLREPRGTSSVSVPSITHQTVISTANAANCGSNVQPGTHASATAFSSAAAELRRNLRNGHPRRGGDDAGEMRLGDLRRLRQRADLLLLGRA